MSFNDIKNAANLTFIPFETGCVLFDEVEQSVLILNQTAAFIWCTAFEVDSLAKLAERVAGEYAVPVAIARQDIQRFFDEFQSCRLFLPKEEQHGSFLRPLTEAPACQPAEPGDVLSLLVDHQLFKISVPVADLKRELSRIYRPFIYSSEVLGHSDREYSVEVCAEKNNHQSLFSIYIDKQCVIESLTQDGVIPFLFGIVFETLWRAEQENPPLMFHAAVLSQQKGQAVVFPAQSGSGKSTLAALLAAKGWQFFTDELAVILPEPGRVLPCPLPICVKEGAVETLSEYYSELKDFMRHRRLDDKQVCYLPVEHAAPFSGDAADIQAIVFPRYDKATFCELSSLGKKEALMGFLECGSAGRAMGVEEVSAVVQMVEQLPCYELVYSDIDSAVVELKEKLVVNSR